MSTYITLERSDEHKGWLLKAKYKEQDFDTSIISDDLLSKISNIDLCKLVVFRVNEMFLCLKTAGFKK
jgi:hypothetical protein